MLRNNNWQNLKTFFSNCLIAFFNKKFILVLTPKNELQIKTRFM